MNDDDYDDDADYNRSSIESMRQEHEASLQRILKTKNQELDVVMSSRDHVKLADRSN